MSPSHKHILTAFSALFRATGFRLVHVFRTCTVRRPLPAYVRCCPLPGPRRIQLR